MIDIRLDRCCRNCDYPDLECNYDDGYDMYGNYEQNKRDYTISCNKADVCKFRDIEERGEEDHEWWK